MRLQLPLAVVPIALHTHGVFLFKSQQRIYTVAYQYLKIANKAAT